jgi:integrase
MGLGAWPEVTLAEARQRVAEERERLRAGGDPISARKAERRAAAAAEAEGSKRTFQAVAESYIARHEASWRNSKHKQQWRSTLASYAYPRIGAMDVGHVDRAAVLDVLEPIWHRAPETASRLRGRIEIVLDFAASKRWRPAENPARWRDLRHSLPKPRAVKKVVHQPALPWRQMPGFIVELRGRPATAARALEFAILTAARTSEVLGATWREIDLNNGIWTVPAKRMKAFESHRVALSPPAMALLKGMQPLAARGDDYLFPGPSKRSPLSTMALLMLLRRMQRRRDENQDQPPRWSDSEGRAVTVHGFRSSFRDWAGDASAFPREVIEAALAHRIKDKAEAAYARSDLLERRRPLMAAWAAYLAGEGATGEVVDLAARRSA